MTMIQTDIKKLIGYGVQRGLVPEEDVVYTANKLLELFGLEELECVCSADKEASSVPESELEAILGRMCDYAFEKGLIAENSVTYRDLFDTKVMGLLVPRPSEVIGKFKELYAQSPQAATDYYYKLSKDSDYIRRYRIIQIIIKHCLKQLPVYMHYKVMYFFCKIYSFFLKHRSHRIADIIYCLLNRYFSFIILIDFSYIKKICQFFRKFFQLPASG